MMDTRSFREIVRTVTVSYPIPFLFAGLIAVLLFCFTGAAVLQGPKSWVFAATGIVSFLVAIGIAIFAVMRKPDLLRSERYSLVSRCIDLVGNNEMSTTDRAGLDRTMLAFLDEDVAKKAVSSQGEPGNGDRRHADE